MMKVTDMNHKIFDPIKRIIRIGEDRIRIKSSSNNRRSSVSDDLSVEGIRLFDQQRYSVINEARLEHLDSLGLDLEGKKILDVGCGIGHLTKYFLKKNCTVVCIDARRENIDEIKKRYPRIDARVMNIETDSLEVIDKFDIVFCYGLVYHLENPLMALRNMASVCREMIIIETMICDSDLPILRLAEEPFTVTQALQGIGCRPSPCYMAMSLDHVGFQYIYTPKTAPSHPEFSFIHKNDLESKRNGIPIRKIFVGSKREIINNNLVPMKYK